MICDRSRTRGICHDHVLHLCSKNNACDKCEKTFFDQSTLIRHKKTVHGVRKDYECKNCKKKFGHKQHLLVHQRTVHEGRKDYGCDMCEKKFGQKTDLLKHQRTVHEDRKDFACDKCITHPCDLCKKVFRLKRSLRLHKDSVHKETRHWKFTIHTTPARKCALRSKCALGVVAPVNLISYAGRAHASRYCGLHATTASLRARHYAKLHKGITHPCDLCEKVFTQKCHLKVHKDAIHKGITHPCDLCKKVFTQKRSLKEHKDSVHNGITHSCDQCENSFTHRKALKLHIDRVHNGKKPNTPKNKSDLRKFLINIAASSTRLLALLEDNPIQETTDCRAKTKAYHRCDEYDKSSTKDQIIPEKINRHLGQKNDSKGSYMISNIFIENSAAEAEPRVESKKETPVKRQRVPDHLQTLSDLPHVRRELRRRVGIYASSRGFNHVVENLIALGHDVNNCLDPGECNSAVTCGQGSFTFNHKSSKKLEMVKLLRQFTSPIDTRRIKKMNRYQEFATMERRPENSSAKIAEKSMSCLTTKLLFRVHYLISSDSDTDYSDFDNFADLWRNGFDRSDVCSRKTLESWLDYMQSNGGIDNWKNTHPCFLLNNLTLAAYLIPDNESDLRKSLLNIIATSTRLLSLLAENQESTSSGTNTKARKQHKSYENEKSSTCENEVIMKKKKGHSMPKRYTSSLAPFTLRIFKLATGPKNKSDLRKSLFNIIASSTRRLAFLEDATNQETTGIRTKNTKSNQQLNSDEYEKFSNPEDEIIPRKIKGHLGQKKDGNLKVHNDSVHNGITHPCDQCEKSFTREANLKLHIDKYLHKRAISRYTKIRRIKVSLTHAINVKNHSHEEPTLNSTRTMQTMTQTLVKKEVHDTQLNNEIEIEFECQNVKPTVISLVPEQLDTSIDRQPNRENEKIPSLSSKHDSNQSEKLETCSKRGRLHTHAREHNIISCIILPTRNFARNFELLPRLARERSKITPRRTYTHIQRK
ncbi:unnamed protein product [Trichogramma brassicae]|uniref:C2H2-type domain-containing protein n=1 Tax=Trichogramma brassicae TaxID=86971 RepID=A0A6H5J1Z6_9HYME|nr:unnamed protein product [Trichogramma brassicae]